MSNKVKPKKRYFQRLRRWIGSNVVLMKLKHWWKQKLRGIARRLIRKSAIGEAIREEMDFALYNTLYEMVDVIENKRQQFFIPKVASVDETVEELLNTEKSFTRFGDGEYVMMFLDGKLGFQQRDVRLSERLKEVLASRDPNLMIGFKNIFGAQGPCADRAEFGELRDHINPLLDANKRYYDACVTRVTQSHKHFLKLKKIWQDKKVVTIEGNLCRLGVGNDLFDNVASLRRILAPADCAFSVYDEILKEALKIEKDVLFLIALGPTATVLAHDLCKAGYRAIDIGHLDICYELFLRKEPHMVAIEGKYVNEVGYRSPSACTDPAYLAQIIAEVKS